MRCIGLNDENAWERREKHGEGVEGILRERDVVGMVVVHMCLCVHMRDGERGTMVRPFHFRFSCRRIVREGICKCEQK